MNEVYGDAGAKIVNFGNLQQYFPESNPKAYDAVTDGLKIGTGKMVAIKAPGYAGQALMKASPGSLSIAHVTGRGLFLASSTVSGVAEIAGAFMLPFGTVAMEAARSGCTCEK